MKDPIFERDVAGIVVLIERSGMCNAMAAFLQAVENIQAEHEDKEDFEGSQIYENLEHVRRVIEVTMAAVDLDIEYDTKCDRDMAKAVFNKNMEKIGRVA